MDHCSPNHDVTSGDLLNRNASAAWKNLTLIRFRVRVRPAADSAMRDAEIHRASRQDRERKAAWIETPLPCVTQIAMPAAL
jgi:hypothetical protein